jgi:hypothetical protein
MAGRGWIAGQIPGRRLVRTSSPQAWRLGRSGRLSGTHLSLQRLGATCTGASRRVQWKRMPASGFGPAEIPTAFQSWGQSGDTEKSKRTGGDRTRPKQNEVDLAPEAARRKEDATQAVADERLAETASIGLKIPRGQPRAGSSPASGTIPARALAIQAEALHVGRRAGQGTSSPKNDLAGHRRRQRALREGPRSHPSSSSGRAPSGPRGAGAEGISPVPSGERGSVLTVSAPVRSSDILTT